MAKPTKIDVDVLRQAESVAKHNVKLIEFFREWEERELRELPFRKDNLAQGQGRCQVLKEVIDFFDQTQAPRNQAKS